MINTWLYFFLRVRKIAKSDYWVRHVCPSVRLEKLGSHGKYFREIWFVKIFRKSVEKIQVSLKLDKNKGHFTWIPMDSYDHNFLISSYNEKCFRQKL